MKTKSAKTSRPIADFQVFKGNCDQTMKAFGSPVMVHHEARLIVREDQNKLASGTTPVYAVYKRSENRILQIWRTPAPVSLKVAA